VDVYAMTVQAGDPRVVDLISDDFDAFMYLVGPGLSDPITDDDGGGRCNARIDFVAPAAGTYKVIVNSLTDTGAGDYTLRVGTRAGPMAEGGCTGMASANTATSSVDAGTIAGLQTEGRVFPVGTEVTGSITESAATTTDGKLAQAWSLEARAGERVVVEVVAEDFDTYLYLTGPGLNGVLVDDDGASGTNSRITFTADQGGTYRVVVSSYGGDAVGSYRLRAMRSLGDGG
jgi:hypothetical protein